MYRIAATVYKNVMVYILKVTSFFTQKVLDKIFIHDKFANVCIEKFDLALPKRSTFIDIFTRYSNKTPIDIKG